MQCDYFDAGTCRSCTEMGVPYPDQLERKERHLRQQLSGLPEPVWLPTFAASESGFRNKAKMAVAGTAAEPTLGILDTDGAGIDLRSCGLCSPGLTAALPVIAGFITHVGLEPYSVPRRHGELKYVLLTESPDGELMLRFVLRSARQVPAIRESLPWLCERLPTAVVISANIHPEHKAVLEGEEEILLTEQESLPMRLDDVTLHLRTRSFFQTNTAVARELYRQGGAWVQEIAPASLWDLYCGVGGFALHTASRLQEHDGGAAARGVTGIELSGEAVASARLSAAEAGLAGVNFLVGDATAFVREQTSLPEMVIVNPPRRGLGPELADLLEASSVEHVVYSSCNAVTLAKDLARMPSLVPQQLRLMDMFPQSHHYETMVLLRRRPS
ncbi:MULTISPECIES: 23S rRNA (uracil(747)-C(5))-methyltransferase RlmC [Arthrobacter]|uniref:23S rRNA (Uracil(747)-C(5))-methyltransferase RlmC n=2 Tax=Arthrobacter TaxID=1663 RepID=A0ABU9KGU7_9MICC|nr:23S rRNA (uracil(747)-C(5))-methyltransferase RlmC [Arthrobacter sp. YJM1]MDP5225987.1 23S rRNA (uracil(747)-C(5))-methyltransferase RlmC [Arthrobacter sp. YJM1]